MKVFGKKRKATVKPPPCFSPLPESQWIHHSMPLEMDHFTVTVCERLGISVWDRDKLWDSLGPLMGRK